MPRASIKKDQVQFELSQAVERAKERRRKRDAERKAKEAEKEKDRKLAKPKKNPEIGNRLRVLCKEASISPAALSSDHMVSLSTARRWLAGTNLPDMNYLELLFDIAMPHDLLLYLLGLTTGDQYLALLKDPKDGLSGQGALLAIEVMAKPGNVRKKEPEQNLGSLLSELFSHESLRGKRVLRCTTSGDVGRPHNRALLLLQLDDHEEAKPIKKALEESGRFGGVMAKAKPAPRGIVSIE